MNTQSKKPTLRKILEFVAYICTAIASFIGGASLM